MFFKTDMGSEAYQELFSLIELDNKLMESTTIDKNLPLTVSRFSEQRVDGILELRESIENEIVSWLGLVIDQERGREDADKLNSMFNNKLSDNGTLHTALEGRIDDNGNMITATTTHND